jgi:hypothetical protein
LPLGETDRVGWLVKVAITEASCVIATVHAKGCTGSGHPPPPDQPEKTDFASGLGVRVTTVPLL